MLFSVFSEILHETERLRALDRFELNKKINLPELDDLTRLAARLCQTSVGLVVMLDADEAWTLSLEGNNLEQVRIPREKSFSQFVIEQDRVVQIENIEEDNQYGLRPHTFDGEKLVFYAGVPLKTRDGYALGTLSVMDDHPRQLNDEDVENLQIIAREVVARLELRVSHKELKRHSDRMEQQAQQDRLLLQEIHHRIKNNLAVVSGLLQMQAMVTDNSEVQNVMEQSQLRLKSIAKIHQKIYESDSLSEVDLKAYSADLVETICEAFSDDNKEFDYRVKGDSFRISIDQAVPCALIINELVTNAYKHGFPNQNGGRVELNLKAANRRVSVEVSDNGRGLPDSFSLDGHDSLGTSLINTLLEQLGADMMIQNGQGATFRFSFELN